MTSKTCTFCSQALLDADRPAVKHSVGLFHGECWDYVEAERGERSVSHFVALRNLKRKANQRYKRVKSYKGATD